MLGKKTLIKVWKDMDRMTLLSWFTTAPRKVGGGQHGKLNADQWRSTCTVNLVVTLIRLWGADEGQYGELLHNFMDLIDAVKIAMM